jgi:pheromone shutdown-related protein TraB
MQKYKNLLILGTSHIAKQSISDVKKYFREYNPDIIALELDKTRLQSLLSKKKLKLKDIKSIGLKGFLFALIASWIENQLGKIVKVKPGTEMITAIKLAKKHNKQITLIDQDIKITLKKISKNLTYKEKLNFLIDLLKAPFQKKMKIDLTKVPEEKTIKKMTSQLKKRYPTLYKILVAERNIIMAKNLYNILNNNQNKKIMAVVGAGHEKEIINLLKDET